KTSAANQAIPFRNVLEAAVAKINISLFLFNKIKPLKIHKIQHNMKKDLFQSFISVNKKSSPAGKINNSAYTLNCHNAEYALPR
ncbi:hypothetical protein, partial [Mixta calida]|uniref:hypothetical protein n=1 Tax=Mixta calida TaxID=665913 RepID=UPI0028A249BD